VPESEGRSESSNGHKRKGYAPAIRAVVDTAEEIRKLDHQLIERVRQRPLAAVAIALAAGYVVGRVFSRWG
jgi:ElaB/YqjD/DUF883 family membrane-anchored ribosome-binding protein